MSPVVPHIPTTRIFEVIIRKNAEPGRNNSNDRRRERVGSYTAMLRRPKMGGDVVSDAASTSQGDKEEFNKAKNYENPALSKTKVMQRAVAPIAASEILK